MSTYLMAEMLIRLLRGLQAIVAARGAVILGALDVARSVEMFEADENDGGRGLRGKWGELFFVRSRALEFHGGGAQGLRHIFVHGESFQINGVEDGQHM